VREIKSVRKRGEEGLKEVNEESRERYSLEDVILPIIGHKVDMSRNKEMREIMERVMKEDGLNY
jgi:chromosome segregation and condensation protein ScpB